MSVLEQQPLIQAIAEDREDGFDDTETILEFNTIPDSEDPRKWSHLFKWSLVLLLAFMSFIVTFTAISVVPIAVQIVAELDKDTNNSSVVALLVTIWELGEAAGPLLIAPLSEIYGRSPVLNVCNIMFILATVLAALSRNTATFIAARVLSGAAVASTVLGPPIIGDIFEAEQRGSAMSLTMLAPLLGGAIGPLISGAIAQTAGWRTVLFLSAGMSLVCEILFLTCFRETYRMAILKRRVATLKRDGNAEASDSSNMDSASPSLRHAITRPAAVLFSSGVLLSLSLFGGVAFSYFYVMSVTLPVILGDIYGYSPAQIGSTFITFSVGSSIAVVVCNFGLDRIYVRIRTINENAGRPEYRLPLAILSALSMPLAITAYGWVAQLHLHISLLLLTLAWLGFVLLVIIVSLSAYVVDAFALYSASALTGVLVARCLMGTFLPLAAAPLASKFGYGWGFTCFGVLSMGLAPIPILVYIYGERWRQRSEYTRTQR